MIRFKMNRITIPQFAILKEEIGIVDIKVRTKVQVKYSLDIKSIGINMVISFINNEEKVMMLELFCEFGIHPEDWDSLIKNNILTLSKEDISYFVAQTIGTARGVFHCKTEGTSFNHIIIPPMNAMEMVKEDLVIKI